MATVITTAITVDILIAKNHFQPNLNVDPGFQLLTLWENVF